MTREMYVSVDIETDGPLPGRNSMLSIGAVALIPGEGDDPPRVVGEFSANLETLPGAIPDQKTMEWWATQPNAWKAHRESTVSAEAAMGSFVRWVEELSEREGVAPVFTAYPAGFDFLFVYWYMMSFVGRSPFSFSALDIKTYAMRVLGLPYRKVGKRELKRFIPDGLPHTHIAIDDAREQGMILMNLMKEKTHA